MSRQQWWCFKCGQWYTSPVDPGEACHCPGCLTRNPLHEVDMEKIAVLTAKAWIVTWGQPKTRAEGAFFPACVITNAHDQSAEGRADTPELALDAALVAAKEKGLVDLP